MGKITERHMWAEGKMVGKEAGNPVECAVSVSGPTCRSQLKPLFTGPWRLRVEGCSQSPSAL